MTYTSCIHTKVNGSKWLWVCLLVYCLQYGHVQILSNYRVSHGGLHSRRHDSNPKCQRGMWPFQNGAQLEAWITVCCIGNDLKFTGTYLLTGFVLAVFDYHWSWLDLPYSYSYSNLLKLPTLDTILQKPPIRLISPCFSIFFSLSLSAQKGSSNQVTFLCLAH